MSTTLSAVERFKAEHLGRRDSIETERRRKFLALLATYATSDVLAEAKVAVDLAAGEATLRFDGHWPILARVEHRNGVVYFDHVEVWYVEIPSVQRVDGVERTVTHCKPFGSFADALVAAARP